MQKLKAIIKKAVNRDILDVYKHANPSTEDFSFTIHCFQTLSVSKKQQIADSLSRKLQRQFNNQQTLNLLILCDFLSATSPHIFTKFPSKMLSSLDEKRKVKGTSKQQKIRLAQSNFNYFYLEYLREKVWKMRTAENISIKNLEEGLIYSDSAINALKLVLRHDFIIEYALANSESRNQIKIAIQNILRRSAQDLAFLIRFIDKWSYVIVEDRVQSVMVNDVYEQLIYVSKNVGKLEFLNGKIQGNIQFARYEINKNLNSKIQKSMVEKDCERRQFYSQKRLKTEGDLNVEAEITESEIHVKIHI